VPFGESGEKLDSNQLEFVLGQITRPAAAPPPPAPEGAMPARPANRPNKKRAPRIPENLPVTEETTGPPEVAANSNPYRRIGEEVTGGGFIPGKSWVARQIRAKYVPSDNAAAAPVITPLSPCLLVRGTADANFAAEIICNRFGLHLPYYRFAEMFAALNSRFDRKTHCDHAMLGAEWLSIIYREIQAEHRRCRYRQFDEPSGARWTRRRRARVARAEASVTPRRLSQTRHRNGPNGLLLGEPPPGGSMLFQWRAGRDAQGAAEMFGDDPKIPAGIDAAEIDGIVHLIQCDGYSAYAAGDSFSSFWNTGICFSRWIRVGTTTRTRKKRGMPPGTLVVNRNPDELHRIAGDRAGTAEGPINPSGIHGGQAGLDVGGISTGHFAHRQGRPVG
jgi:transposase